MHMTFFFVGEMFFVGEAAFLLLEICFFVGEAVFLLLEICFFVGEAVFLLLKRQFICWKSGDCFGWRSAFSVMEAGHLSEEIVDKIRQKAWTKFVRIRQIV